MHCQCEDIWLICIALVGLALHCFPSKCCSIARTIHRWSGCADTRIDSGVCPISPRHTSLSGGWLPNFPATHGAGPQLCDTAADLDAHLHKWRSPTAVGGSFAQILHKSCAYRAYLFRLSSRLCRCTTICILLILPDMKHISPPTRWK